MRHYIYIIGVTIVTAVLLASCGKQHRAESVVKDFIEANSATPDDVRSIDFRSIDSTRVITDSIIMAMRKQAAQSSRYRNDITFEQGEITLPLVILRTTYRIYDQECSDTYYLDRDITRVVAVKTN